MENKTNIMEPLFERIEEYAKTNYELLKLKTIDKITELLSTFVSRFSSIVILLTSLVFLNIGIALWLGDLLGKTYYGFLCVAGFYFIVWIVVHFFMHNWIKKRVGNSIISQLLK
jgi:lipopolysaccharide export LptBFGC system permease protein LptF